MSSGTTKAILNAYKAVGAPIYGAGSGEGAINTDVNAGVRAISTPRNSQNILQKAGAVVSQTAKMGAAVGVAGAKFVANTGKDIARTAYSTGETFANAPGLINKNANINNSMKELDARSQRIQNQYKTGKLSKKDYAEQMKMIADSYEVLSGQSKEVLRESQKYDNPMNLVESAVNVLSVGKGQSLIAGGKAALTGELDNLILKGARSLEDAFTKVPAVRELFKRQASGEFKSLVQQAAGETLEQAIKRNGKQAAIGLLLKRPIFYQTNIGLADDTINHILEGDYGEAAKSSAWIAAQGIGGGPIGYFLKNGKRLGVKAGELARGKNSFIDTISARVGDGNMNQIGEYIKNNPAAKKAWLQMQAVNMHMADGDVKLAAENFLRNYSHLDPKDLTPEYLTKTANNWVRADELAVQESERLYKGAPVRFVPVRWDTPTKEGFAKAAAKAMKDNPGNIQAQVETIGKILDDSEFAQNTILRTKLEAVLAKNLDDPKGFRKAVKEISTTATLSKDVSARVRKEAAELGYTFAEPYGGRRTPVIEYDSTKKIVSSISKGGGDELFDPTVAPTPVLHEFAGALTKVGLSPEANNKVAYNALTDSMINTLEATNNAKNIGLQGSDKQKGGQYILSKLQAYIDDIQPSRALNVLTGGINKNPSIYDLRQLTVKEIRTALKVGESTISVDDAKALKTAIRRAYTDLPMDMRGLGVKAVDYAYRVPGFAAYSRIQGALRYTYNPFFRTQEVIETKLLAHSTGNNLIWLKPKAELNAVSKKLDDAGIFTTGFSGEGARDLVLGRITANILDVQKRDLAGLALKMAQRKGVDIDTMIAEHSDELVDGLRVIVQYGEKGILNSPLARTLNVAFFPMRYNLKVSWLIARELGKMPPSYQLAFINSMFSARDWLKSDEGIAWQSQYQDAIQVFSYFSPINNVSYVMKALARAKDRRLPESTSELGLLGGLPFGFISQILDAEGIINLSTPYVDPKTGEVSPKYIPESSKAKASAAIESFVGTMFNYPGRILGLPGKGENVRKLVDNFIDAGGDEYLKDYREEDLTPLQKSWIRVLKGDTSPEAIDALYTSPAPEGFQWYTIPPSTLPSFPRAKTMTKTELLETKQKAKGSKGKKQKPKALPLAPIA